MPVTATRRCLGVVTLVQFTLASAVLLAAAPQVEQALEGLRSGSAFERQQSETDLRRLGDDALDELVEELDHSDKLYRLRVEQIFAERMDGFLSELDNEYQALELDRRELAGLRRRQEQVAAFGAFAQAIEARRADDPEIAEKVQRLLELEALEALREEALAAGPVPEGGGQEKRAGRFSEQEEERLAELRQLQRSWQEDESFERSIEQLLDMARRVDAAAVGQSFAEVEGLRLKELEERVLERRPRVERMQEQLDALGLPAFNRVLARSAGVHERVLGFHDTLVSRGAKLFSEDFVDVEDAASEFERQRYNQALLWIWHVERGAAPGSGDSEAPQAPVKDMARLVERHLQATLDDLRSTEPLAQERAAEELFLLGDRGRAALQANIAEREGETSALARERFLATLLRWRISPKTYAQVGMDFSSFEQLEFRQRRQKVFDYARVARERAIPTLRAIVTDDQLEGSFFVKLAAAKALAGLRDLSGYTHLLLTHPDMTIKKPEVSRELLVIQAYESIREKRYDEAIQILQQVLDEDPFDFRANYHIAFAYLLLKNYGKSIRHFEIARRINANDQLTLYNLACAYALHGGMTEKALDALTASTEAGFDDYEHMDRDPDLASLRNEPRYRELIERLQGK